MEPARNEFVILYADASLCRQPLPIYSGDPPEPIAPDWLVITESLIPGCVADTFLLYFLRENGEILEVLQWETLEIALDQADSIAGMRHSSWSRCRLQVPESGRIARWLIT